MSALLVLIVAAGIALSRIPSVIESRPVAVDSKAAAASAVNAADTAPGQAGMMAYIDPETGELTTAPPASALELGADLQNALRRDDAGLVVVKHADGSKSLNLQGRYQHVSIARIDENGKLSVCTDNAASVANTFNNTAASTSSALEVK